MAKWADYGVLRVKYNVEHTKIVEIEVAQDPGAKPVGVWRMRREDVVSAIEHQRKSFVTMYWNDREYRRGADIHTVFVDDEKYLRTDTNSTRADNLGSLPEYT